MSPYRIAVKETDDSVRVYAAMLSIDKKTARRRILIVERVLPAIYPMTWNDVIAEAHRMTCIKNSVIKAGYEFIKQENHTYAIFRSDWCKPGTYGQELDSAYYTQSDCLVACMHDYVAIHDLEVLAVI